MKGVWQRHEETLQRAFHLTDREARVAAECLKGTSYAGIAERFGVKPDTISKQLKSVYAKANVHSRGELAAALLIRM